MCGYLDGYWVTNAHTCNPSRKPLVTLLQCYIEARYRGIGVLRLGYALDTADIACAYDNASYS